MKKAILILAILILCTTNVFASAGARIYGSTAEMTAAPILGATSCNDAGDPASCCTGSGTGTCTALEDGDISLVGSATQGFLVYIYDIDGTDADTADGITGLRPDDYVDGGYWNIVTAFAINGSITLGSGGDPADTGTAGNFVNGATLCWEDATEDCFTHVDNTGFSVNRNFAAATYASDGSVSDTELKYINTLSGNAQDALDSKATTSTKIDDFAAPDDNTDLNVSTSAHGLAPKLSNDAATWLDGTGAYSAPSAAEVGAATTSTKLDDFATPDDNTDLNVSTTYHGLAPKLSNDAATWLDGTGAYSAPTAGEVGAQGADADLTTWAGITPGSNVGTFLATPSGPNLASALTSALPASKGGTGLTSLGANVATFLGTPSSANLISALTDESGTGAAVFMTTLTAGTDNWYTTGTIRGAVPVLSYSSNQQLSAANSYGAWVIATAAMTLTLPDTLAAGMSGCFTNEEGDTTIIGLNPGSGNHFSQSGATGTDSTTYASTSAQGNKICWIATAADTAYIASTDGTWSE